MWFSYEEISWFLPIKLYSYLVRLDGIKHFSRSLTNSKIPALERGRVQKSLLIKASGICYKELESGLYSQHQLSIRLMSWCSRSVATTHTHRISLLIRQFSQMRNCVSANCNDDDDILYIIFRIFRISTIKQSSSLLMLEHGGGERIHGSSFVYLMRIRVQKWNLMACRCYWIRYN